MNVGVVDTITNSIKQKAMRALPERLPIEDLQVLADIAMGEALLELQAIIKEAEYPADKIGAANSVTNISKHIHRRQQETQATRGIEINFDKNLRVGNGS